MRGARGHDGDEERCGGDEEPGVVGGSKGRVLTTVGQRDVRVYGRLTRVRIRRDSFDCSWLLLTYSQGQSSSRVSSSSY